MKRIRIAVAVAVAVATGLASACSAGDDASQAPPADGVSAVGAVTETVIHLPDSAGDDLGYANRLAIGDITGDGINDLLVGAPGADGPAHDRPDAGAVYVVRGGDVPEEVNLPADAVLVVHGAQSGDGLGFAVASGDLNGDSTADLIAGAIGSNGLENLRTDMGEAFVFFGGPGLTGERDLMEKEQDFLLQPAEGFSHLGTSFATGDVNGDGIDDLVAGAPYAGRPFGSPVGSPRTTVGEVYVVFGRSDLSGVARVADDDEDALLSGAREFDQFGTSVAVSDVDGDGLGDIIVGAPGYEKEDGAEDGGGVLVFEGRPAFPERMDVSGADFIATSDSASARLGSSVAAGDLEGDGKMRILMGAPTAGTPEKTGTGLALMVEYGHGPTTVGVSGNGSIRGADVGDFFPSSLVPGPADKPPAIIAGAVAAGGGEGAVYVLAINGGTAIDLASPPPGSQVIRGAPGEGLGAAIAGGDIDGDGKPEIAVLAAGVSGQPEAMSDVVYVLSP